MFTAVKPVTILGKPYGRGDSIPVDIADKVDIRKLVRSRLVAAPASVDLDALEAPPPAKAQELLPLDTPAQRNAARAQLADMEASLEEAEAVGLKPEVAVLNAVAAYKSMLADVARTMRNPDTGDVGVSGELLAAMDATAGDDAGEPEALPEGTIPTAEDGNVPDGGESAVLPETPGKAPPVAQEAKADAPPPEPPPASPSASSGKGGRRK